VIGWLTGWLTSDWDEQQMSTDDQFDSMDHDIESYESKRSKLSGAQQEEWVRKRAIAVHNRQNKILENCYNCVESPKFVPVGAAVLLTSVSPSC